MNLFIKALQSLEACLSVNNNLHGKDLSKSQITFEVRFKVTSVTFFIPNFNLLSCELDKFISMLILY